MNLAQNPVEMPEPFGASAIIPGAVSLFGLQPSWVIILQISIRFLLAATVSIAAAIALVSLYNWINNDGNEIKSFENKERLGKMLMVITAAFVLMALFRLWVPDYASLSL
jgi:hypothetical protein